MTASISDAAGTKGRFGGRECLGGPAVGCSLTSGGNAKDGTLGKEKMARRSM
ncbi:MAG: hypothetical protein QOE61_903 [Micromonosporaceae bacterium]|nr:hypothetical protein [Micromonosporaceae bacterium]